MTIKAIMVAAICVAAAGCAAPWEGLRAQFHADVALADQACVTARFSTLSAKIRCYERVERPVLARDDPMTFPIYEQFAEVRRNIASQVDGGSMTKAEYDVKLAEVGRLWRSAWDHYHLAQWNQSAPPELALVKVW